MSDPSQTCKLTMTHSNLVLFIIVLVISVAVIIDMLALVRSRRLGSVLADRGGASLADFGRASIRRGNMASELLVCLSDFEEVLRDGFAGRLVSELGS